MKRKEKAKGKTVNVLAAVRISRASGRDNLSGIFRFIEQNSGWQLHLVQYNEEFSSAVVRSAKDSGFDGIIATIPGSDATIAALAETPLPIVLVNVHGPALAKRKGPTAIIRNLVSNSGDSGSAELLAEVRALRDEVAGLRAEQREPAAATVRLSNQFNNVSEGGNALRTEVMA